MDRASIDGPPRTPVAVQILGRDKDGIRELGFVLSGSVVELRHSSLSQSNLSLYIYLNICFGILFGVFSLVLWQWYAF